MKKINLLVISLLMSISVMPAFEFIDNAFEFRSILDKHDYVFVAFVDLSTEEGDHIKDKVQALSLKGDFGGIFRDRFAFVVIPAQKEKFSRLTHKYGYEGSPLFALFEFEQFVATSDLDGYHSIGAMEQFIDDSIAESLADLKEDIREAHEADRIGEQYYARPRLRIGLGTGFYPRYGYYRAGTPYWWYRRYYKHPYRHYHGSGRRVRFR